MAKNLPAIQETQVQSLGVENHLKTRLATHSSILAWRIPRTEEPGGLQSKLNTTEQLTLSLFHTIVIYVAGRITVLSLLFSHSVVSNSLWPYGLQHTKFPCPSPSPGAHSDSIPLCWWCHPTISFSVTLFSSCLQSFPASGSFLNSQLSASGGQSFGASTSASILPLKIQDWFPLRLTGLSSLQSKGLSRVFFNTTVQKHQFFSTQLSLWSNSHIHMWQLRKP